MVEDEESTTLHNLLIKLKLKCKELDIHIIIFCHCVWTFQAGYKSEGIDRSTAISQSIAMALSPPFTILFTLAIAWIVWRLIRNFVMRSPLDNIPGPRSESWLKGVHHLFNPSYISNLNLDR